METTMQHPAARPPRPSSSRRPIAARPTSTVGIALAALAALLVGCSGAATAPGDPAPVPAAPAPGPAPDAPGPLVVYSGRTEDLIGPVLAAFTEETGIELEVRYGDTAELAAALLNEGAASPADVYLAQDAGALGAVASAGAFAPLPADVLDIVDAAYRATDGTWIGLTGRVRVLAYDTRAFSPEDLPTSVTELTDPRWRGRVGWAPTNGSFQAFVTALRLTAGEDAARAWLVGMLANDVQPYEKNTALVEALARGEIAVGLTNHYYVLRVLAEDPSAPVANHYLPGDIGGLINVSGAGILASSRRPEAALRLIEHLLSVRSQTTFAQRPDAAEFPMRAGVAVPGLPSLATLEPPALDLSRLEDLQGTLALLQEVGALD
jgi:iron(III) transport system substrate-binding protein